MGEARDAADRMTAAVTTSRDLEELAECYRENAVAITPDQGELSGRESITEYFRQFLDSFTNTSSSISPSTSQAMWRSTKATSPGPILEPWWDPMVKTFRRRASRSESGNAT